MTLYVRRTLLKAYLSLLVLTVLRVRVAKQCLTRIVFAVLCDRSSCNRYGVMITADIRENVM